MTTAQTITISSSRLTAEISTLGAELQRLTTGDGVDLQWDGDPAVWHGRAPILFPVIGLLEGNRYHLDGATYPMGKHGFARHSTFDLVSSTANTAELRLSATAETRVAYPFEFQLDIDFDLADDTLTLGAVISNHGDTAMPASFGFHPALRWPLPFGHPRSEHRVLFESDEPAPVRRIDQNGFLTPTPHPTPIVGDALLLRDDLFVDDALIFDRLTSRRVQYGASTGPQLAVAFTDFPTLGIWTKPGANFVCIEPWHGFSDPVGFDGDIRDKPGIFEIEPQGTKSMTMSITLTQASAA